jgi:hypothetical protein
MIRIDTDRKAHWIRVHNALLGIVQWRAKRKAKRVFADRLIMTRP